MKKDWYEYEPFDLEELMELKDRAEGLRDSNRNLSVEYKIACLELEVACCKLFKEAQCQK